MIFLQLLSSQKCEKIENIRRFFVILFVYFKDFQYLCGKRIKNELFKQYKGALTEQFVLQELQQLEEALIHYWSPDESIAEMDFVIQYNGAVTPIEVKAEQNIKAKSIPVYIAQNHPARVIRTSLAPYHKGEKIEDIPLYACLCLMR